MSNSSLRCSRCGAPINIEKTGFLTKCGFCGKPTNPRAYYIALLPLKIFKTSFYFAETTLISSSIFLKNNIRNVYKYFIQKLSKLSQKDLSIIFVLTISGALFFVYVFAVRGFRFINKFPFIISKTQINNNKFKKNLKDSSYYLSQAKIKDFMREYEAGLYFVNEAIKLSPYSDEAYFQKARLLYSLNRFQDSIDVINKAIEINPKNESFFYYRGISNAKLGNSELAIKDLKEAILIDSQIAQTHNVLGDIYSEFGNYEEAKKSYSEFTKLEPNNYKGFYLVGITLQELKNHSEAIKFFSKAIALNPKDPYAYFKRAFSYWYIGKPDKSCNDYVSAQTLGIDIKNNGMYSSLCN